MYLISVLADMLICAIMRDSIGRCFGAEARFHSARRSGEETCKKIQKKERGEAGHKTARKTGHTVSGYTISVILFALAINMIVKSAELECRGPLTKTEVCQPPVRAFMDILTITFTSSPDDVDETAKA